jgi:hypothetical protein
LFHFNEHLFSVTRTLLSYYSSCLELPILITNMTLPSTIHHFLQQCPVILRMPCARLFVLVSAIRFMLRSVQTLGLSTRDCTNSNSSTTRCHALCHRLCSVNRYSPAPALPCCVIGRRHCFARTRSTSCPSCSPASMYTPYSMLCSPLIRSAQCRLRYRGRQELMSVVFNPACYRISGILQQVSNLWPDTRRCRL